MTGFPVERYVKVLSVPDDEVSMPATSAHEVRDVMTRDVISVTETTAFKDIARLIERHRVHGVPVVDDQRRVQGMVTASDLLARVAGTDHTMPRGHRITAHHANALKRHALTAVELMTARAITVQPQTSIVAAARLAARFRVRSLPVVDAEGTLLGIVTRDDLVKVFLRPDDAIETELRREVIDPLPLPPGQHVEVQLSDGVVTLTGQVGTVMAARSVEQHARAVPGVVEVQNELGYEFDDSYLPAHW